MRRGTGFTPSRGRLCWGQRWSEVRWPLTERPPNSLTFEGQGNRGLETLSAGSHGSLIAQVLQHPQPPHGPRGPSMETPCVVGAEGRDRPCPAPPVSSLPEGSSGKTQGLPMGWQVSDLSTDQLGQAQGGCRPRAWTSLLFFAHLFPHLRPRSRHLPAQTRQVILKVQRESRVVAAVIVCPLLARHFISLPGSPGI